jgi:hypothetical protein
MPQKYRYLRFFQHVLVSRERYGQNMVFGEISSTSFHACGTLLQSLIETEPEKPIRSQFRSKNVQKMVNE